MNRSTFLLALLFSLTWSPLEAQTFSAFAGDLISLPETTTRYGYDDRPTSPDSVIKQLVYPKLDFLPRDRKVNFPGVEKEARFAFLLRSTLTIAEDGCYEFSLASDDGSRLWIDDSLVINNDGAHKWRVRRDTQSFRAGTYAAKVWYYNAYIPIMGLALNCKKMEEDHFCEAEKITLPADMLFAFGEASINSAVSGVLDTLAMRLTENPAQKVTITGHTDDVGSAAFNQKLSLLRAKSVLTYLKKKLPEDVFDLISFATFGSGESEAIQDNATAEGRAENRRVDILVE